MIQLLDKIIDKQNKEVVIVKMDIKTYENLVGNKDITEQLHELEIEAKKNSKTYDNVDDLFFDLER